MSKYPKVSIIIPTKNRSNFLRKSIEMAFSQTYKNFEVVVSNNNSKDDTEKELKNLSKVFPELRIVNHNVNYSISKHWDKIITEIAIGEFLIIIPDDDYLIDKNYLKDAIEIFKENNTLGIVFANYDIINYENEVIQQVRINASKEIQKEYLISLFKRNYQGTKGFGIPQLTALFSREAYINSKGFDLDCLSPDTHLWLKVLVKYNAGFINRPVAHYLLHNSNLSNTRSLSHLKSDLSIIPNVIQFYKTQNREINVYVFMNFLRIQFFFIRVYIGKLREALFLI